MSICNDKDINEVLQIVRKIKPMWFIDERTHEITRWFRKPKLLQRFTVYEKTDPNEKGTIEVRIQMSANTKSEVLNFLYGLNVGLHLQIN